jgi:transposase-like protein
MSKVLRQYSESFKRSVVAEIESGRYTVLGAAGVHQVSAVSLYKWVKKLGHPESQTRIVRIEMPTKRDRIKELEKEKRALESALAQAHPYSVAKCVSPLTYVRKGLPPILTIHGDNDQLASYSHAVRLHEALAKAGVINQLLTIPWGRHGGFTKRRDDEDSWSNTGVSCGERDSEVTCRSAKFRLY